MAQGKKLVMKVPSQPRKCGRICCCTSSVCCSENSCYARNCCLTRAGCIRRKRCLKRNSRFFKDICALYVVTFLVVVPLLTLNLRHTAFDFLKRRNVTLENERMLKENAERYNHSLSILKKLEDRQFRDDLNIFRNLLEQRPSTTEEQRPLLLDGIQPGIAITVITVSRSAAEDHEPHYLTQVVAALLRLMTEYELLLAKYGIHFSVCNVDSHPTSHVEVQTLPKWIPVYTRYQNLSKKSDIKPILNKEKDDYAFCLDQTLERNMSHVLLVEDDALPLDELFLVLDTMVLSGSKRHKNLPENVTYYKLYHPERLLGYISLEFERIPELLSLSTLLSLALLLIYRRLRTNISTPPIVILVSLFIYSCLLFLAIGRVNMIEFRRFSRHLYQMTPSPSCCTPAMLFTRDGGKRISEYLKTVIDRTRFAKDIAIDEYIRKNRLVTRFIQPNLFKHIGHVSSLRLKLLDPYIV